MISKGITDGTSQLPATQTFGLASAISSRALFWPAHFLKPDPAAHQIPLLFWLLDCLRPHSLVSLGGWSGVSYFAACQALDKLDCEALCQALGPWPEDGIPESLQEYNRKNFGDFSTLRDDAPMSAWTRIARRRTEFLLVDLEITEEIATSIREDWIPGLSEKGVVLLHGLSTHCATPAGEALVDHLQAHWNTFRQDVGDGCLVVFPGHDYPERIEKLAQLTHGAPGYADVHRVMSRLGRVHYMEAQQRQLETEAKQALNDLEAARTALAERSDVLEQVQGRLKDLDSAYEKRHRELATVQARLFDLEQDGSAKEALEQSEEARRLLQAAHDKRLLRQKDLEHELGLVQAELKALRTQTEEQRRQHEAELQSSRKPLEQLAQLEKKKAEAEEAAARHLAFLESRKREVEELKGSRAELSERNAALQKEIEDLTSASQARAAEQQAELEARQREVSALEAARTELSERNAALQKEIEGLTSASEAQAAEQQAELEARQREVSALEAARAELSERNAALQKENEELTSASEARAAEQQAELEARQREVSALEAARTELSERNAALQKEIEGLTAASEARAAEQQAELEDLSGRLAAETDAKERERAERLRLEQELDARFGELAALTTRLESTSADHEVQLAERQQELERTLEQLRSREAALEDAKHTQADLKRVQANLKRTLETQTASAAARENEYARQMALLEEQLRQEQNVREQQQTSRFEEIARLIRKLDAQEVLAQQASVRAEQDAGKIERLNHLLAEFKEAQVGQSVLLRRREGELEETRYVLQDLQAKLDERESRLTILEEEKRLLIEQFEAILKSSSWKLTAPIRKIVMTARRGR